jgi:WD40 repeat protein
VADSPASRENLVARALVRVLDRSTEPVGFGLLVASGKVVTCAHVAALSFGETPGPEIQPPPGRVLLDFPFLAPGRILTAEPVAWQQSVDRGGNAEALVRDGGDVAGLVLDSEAPPGAVPLALTRGGNVGGHGFQAYGYRDSDVGAAMPTWVPGRILGRTEGGWLQLGVGELTGGLRIDKGFSGTPVWDEQNGQVVGLVTGGVSRKSSKGQPEWLAYAVSGEAIFDAWSELREFFERACPFRSLVPFTSADSGIFFGRDQLALEVTERVTRSEHTILTGASGAGKTSLMNAKVIPELERLGHSVIYVRPGTPDSLWTEVAGAIKARSNHVVESTRELSNAFAAEALDRRIVRLCDALGNDRVVVVADQFEELLHREPQQAAEFAAELWHLTSVRHPEGRPHVRVVIIVREDDQREVLALPAYDASAGTTVEVGPLTADQLRSAVEQPVRITGFARYEATLVDRIIDDISVQPYSLPALQVILTELWQRMGPDGFLRHSVYQELNQGDGPLATALHNKWNALTRDNQAAALRLFLHLAIPIGEDEFARRTTSQAEMSVGDWQIAGTLATLRLIVLRASPTVVATAELVHDALLKQWPTLREYLRQHWEFLQWRDDARRQIRIWEQEGRQSAQLISGKQLRRAVAVLSSYPDKVSERELGFINASRRRRVVSWRRRIVAAGAAIACVIAVTTALVARANMQASYQRDSAISENLASKSESIGGTNPVLSRLLAVAAWRLSPSGQTARQAWQAMLDTAANPAIRIFGDQASTINSAAFSPDGKTLAEGTDKGGVRLWNTVTGQPISTLVPASRSGTVYSVAFSPDGKILASGGSNPNGDGQVQLWNTATGRPVRTLLVPTPLPIYIDGVSSVAFSPDGKIVAAATGNGQIQLWDTATGQPIRAWLAASYATAITSIVFSPDGKILASGADDVRLWNVATGQPIGTLHTSHQSGVNSVAFSPDGKILAASGGTTNGGSHVQLWSTATRKPIGTPLATSGNPLAFSPDGTTLASGDGPDGTQLWNIATGQLVGSLPASATGPVSWVGFSPDGKILASVGVDGEIELWNADAIKPRIIPPTASYSGMIDTVAFSPDGKILASGDQDGEGSDGRVQLWNVATGQPIGAPLTASPDNPVNSVAFSPDGKILASADGDGDVRLWDTATRQPIGTLLASPRGEVLSVAFSPDGKILASADDNDQVLLWNTTTWEPVGTLLTSSAAGSASSVAFSPDGKTLAAGTANGQIQLWNTATRQPIRTQLASSAGGSPSVAFSPDGKTLAISSGEGPLQLWNTATGQLTSIPLPASSTGSFGSVAFSPDGKTLAAGTASGQIQLWNTATRQPIGALLPGSPSGGSTSMAFSPDGKTLIEGSADGSFQLWDVSYLDNVVPYLCALAGRSLTREEWAQYVSSGPAYLPACP